MKRTTLQIKHSMNRGLCPLALLLIPVGVVCCALPWQVQADSTEGCDSSGIAILISDGLLNDTTADINAAIDEGAVFSNTTDSDNALASWIWRHTHRLRKAHYSHTATLLQNGQVLAAGGIDSTGHISASAELY